MAFYDAFSGSFPATLKRLQENVNTAEPLQSEVCCKKREMYSMNVVDSTRAAESAPCNF